MIKIILISFLSFASLSTTNSQYVEPDCFNLPTQGRVFICGGKYAKRFHSHSRCKGLNNCKGGIYYIDSAADAIRKGFSYCNICWK